jgi:hypothetical protein
MKRWMLVVALLLLGCSKNEAASQACKGATADSDTCNNCCKANGASGYTYVNGQCGCLGGG